MSEQDIEQLVPLAMIRNDQISFQLDVSGRKISVKQASAEDFFAFIEQAITVLNVERWSIFMRWHAINIGLEAGTLKLSRDEVGYLLLLADEQQKIAESA